jgi:RNA polymerase sigma factor (sigma-70 family)
MSLDSPDIHTLQYARPEEITRIPDNLWMEIEHDIIEQAKENPKLFGILYMRYYERILNYIHKSIREKEESEQLTQDIFIAIFKKLPTLNPQESLLSYLYTSARNRIINYRTRGNRRFIDPASRCNPTLDIPLSIEEILQLIKFQLVAQGSIPSPEDTLTLQLKEIIVIKLRSFIGQLSDVSQLVIQYKIEGKTNKEIAIKLNRTEGAIKQIYRRALLKLDQFFLNQPDFWKL